MRFVYSSLLLVFALSSLSSQTVQGTIQKTGANTVIVYGKPSSNLNSVTFDNIVVCISIPEQNPNPTPVATITANHIPNFSWVVPSGYPHTTGGRTYFAFNGNDNNNNQTATWLSTTDNPVIEVTFSGGGNGASEIVELNDRTESGGGPGYDYWYVQIVGLGDVTAYGNLFYGAGAVNAGDSYVPTSQPVSLPVELLTFRADRLGEKVVLQWHTASEFNCYSYQVQRSFDGKSWSSIGEVPGHGTTIEESYYSLEDDSPLPGNNYYRLKQIDFDRGFEYSNVVSVAFLSKKATSVILFPNPANESITLESQLEEPVELTVYDILGRQVQQIRLTPKDRIDIDIAEWYSGIYTLSGIDAGKYITLRLVKE